jgi:hypothetical protein
MIECMARRFHVTSAANRGSIQEFGLDWTRMGAARGVAGSYRPEAEGCFLAEEWEVDWFVQMNNTGGPVDIWAVDHVDEGELVDNGNGYFYLPGVIAPRSLTLLRTDIPPTQSPPPGVPAMSDGAYHSTLTIRPMEPPVEQPSDGDV